MRLMSFRLTTGPFMSGDKDVSRRLGWTYLKPGEHFMAVRQAQGLRKGEKVQRLGECVCIANTQEELGEIIRKPVRRIKDPSRWPSRWAKLALKCDNFHGNKCADLGYFCLYSRCRGILPETAREGFPELTPEQFVEMFCREMSTRKHPVTPETIINRIEFARVVA